MTILFVVISLVAGIACSLHFSATDLRDQAETHALEFSRRADAPQALQELPPNWKMSPLRICS
jgi:hypothetical protein